MCSATGTSNSADHFLTMSHRRIIWSITSSQFYAQRRPIHCFISVSERTTHPTHGIPHPTGAHNIPSPSQRRTTHPDHGLPHPTEAHNIPSSSQRGTTHKAHGLSLKSTHSVCVLEDVSRSCNHQQHCV
jgi:hypothetical protein